MSKVDPMDSVADELVMLRARVSVLEAERAWCADQIAALEHDIDCAHASLDEALIPVGTIEERAELAGGEQDMLITIDELNRELFHGNHAGHLVTLRKLGAVTLHYLAGIQACDAPAPAAAKGGDQSNGGPRVPACFVKGDSIDGDDVCSCRGNDATPDDACICTIDPDALVQPGEHPICVHCGAEVYDHGVPKGGAHG